MKTNVYIDGFNLFYGCLKGTRDKWLDLGAFCQAALPNDTINHIRYFTALVKSNSSDLNRTNRQQVYLRALTTIPNLSIHHGQFLKSVKRGRLIDPKISGVGLVRVETWEEKGSDVNIATHLLADGFRGDYEQAVVISNDSDLVEPIVLVQRELNLAVGVLSPHGPFGKPSYHLQKVSSSYNLVDRSLFASCQLPPIVIDAQGRTITKPPEW